LESSTLFSDKPSNAIFRVNGDQLKRILIAASNSGTQTDPQELSNTICNSTNSTALTSGMAVETLTKRSTKTRLIKRETLTLEMIKKSSKNRLKIRTQNPNQANKNPRKITIVRAAKRRSSELLGTRDFKFI